MSSPAEEVEISDQFENLTFQYELAKEAGLTEPLSSDKKETKTEDSKKSIGF